MPSEKKCNRGVLRSSQRCFLVKKVEKFEGAKLEAMKAAIFRQQVRMREAEVQRKRKEEEELKRKEESEQGLEEVKEEVLPEVTNPEEKVKELEAELKSLQGQKHECFKRLKELLAEEQAKRPPPPPPPPLYSDSSPLPPSPSAPKAPQPSGYPSHGNDRPPLSPMSPTSPTAPMRPPPHRGYMVVQYPLRYDGPMGPMRGSPYPLPYPPPGPMGPTGILGHAPGGYHGNLGTLGTHGAHLPHRRPPLMGRAPPRYPPFPPHR